MRWTLLIALSWAALPGQVHLGQRAPELRVDVLVGKLGAPGRVQVIEQILVGLVPGGVYVASIGMFLSDGSSHQFVVPFFVPEA